MPGPGKPFVKGQALGRPKGIKNKKTIVLERVYQRCLAKGFHPADYMVEVARDPEVPQRIRLQVCERLLMYMEGFQPESKPLVPSTTKESVESAQATMKELETIAGPLDKPSTICTNP